MKVELAGLNIDSHIVEEIAKHLPERRDALSPETISASYARISRSKKGIAELRREAIEEVERARKSNQNIIFKMGHSSVAEHAVFNFDVSGISRFAVEYIQSFRLASFTEKSQRYVLFDKEYYTPLVFSGDNGIGKRYRDVVENLAGIYKSLFGVLKTAGIEEEKAKEDSRYATSLSTLTQFGMTVNARVLEYMIVRLKNSPFEELRNFAEMLYSSVKDIVPSLVKYIGEDPYYRVFYPDEESIADCCFEKKRLDGDWKTYPKVNLVDYDEDGEKKVVSSILFSFGGKEYKSYGEEINRNKQESYFDLLFSHMKSFHPLPRFFEMASLTFEIELSASAFAQLKRHRMAVLVNQMYLPELGFTVPPTVDEAKATRYLEDAYRVSTDFFYDIVRDYPLEVFYVLTNAHRRRVVIKLDVREIYHISRLREDIHAQWEIREVAKRIVEIAREKYPLLMRLASGKDRFNELKKGLGY